MERRGRELQYHRGFVARHRGRSVLQNREGNEDRAEGEGGSAGDSGRGTRPCTEDSGAFKAPRQTRRGYSEAVRREKETAQKQEVIYVLYENRQGDAQVRRN